MFIFGCAGSLLLWGLFSSCRQRGLLSRRGAWASHCGGFSCRGAGALVRTGLHSCSPGLWSTGFVVVVHRLSCSVACRMLLDQGSNRSLALQGKFFTSEPPGKRPPLYPTKSLLIQLIILVGMIPWRRERLPTPVFWPGEFHRLYRPWGRKELDMTERLSVILVNISETASYWSISFTHLAYGKQNRVDWVNMFEKKWVSLFSCGRIQALSGVWIEMWL